MLKKWFLINLYDFFIKKILNKKIKASTSKKTTVPQGFLGAETEKIGYQALLILIKGVFC